MTIKRAKGRVSKTVRKGKKKPFTGMNGFNHVLKDLVDKTPELIAQFSDMYAKQTHESAREPLFEVTGEQLRVRMSHDARSYFELKKLPGLPSMTKEQLDYELWRASMIKDGTYVMTKKMLADFMGRTLWPPRRQQKRRSVAPSGSTRTRSTSRARSPKTVTRH